MVISHRKQITNKTLDKIQIVLMPMGIFVNNDFSVGLIEHQEPTKIPKTRKEKNDEAVRKQFEDIQRRKNDYKNRGEVIESILSIE